MAIKIVLDAHGSAVVSVEIQMDAKLKLKQDIERAVLSAASSLLARSAECLRTGVTIPAAEAEANVKLTTIAAELAAMKAAMNLQSNVR